MTEETILEQESPKSDETCIFSYDSGFCCSLNEKIRIVDRNEFDCKNCKHRTTIKEYLIGNFNLDVKSDEIPLCLFCSHAVKITALSRNNNPDAEKVFKICCDKFSLTSGIYLKTLEDCESYYARDVTYESVLKKRIADLQSFGEWIDDDY